MSDVDDLGLGLSDDDRELDEVSQPEVDVEEPESEEEVEEKNLSISIPRHNVNEKAEDETYSLKLPVFLNVDAHPFDATEFKETIEYNAEQRKQIKDKSAAKNDLIKEKLSNQNTIRWRYVNENDEIIKQSNAHFIEWDNGLISLKIGDEIFDLKKNTNYDNLLVKSYDEFEILQSDSIVSHTVNLLPTSIRTATHRQLTSAVKSVQMKDKILNTITTSDPLEIQRVADENERRAMKLKRQLDLKRRLQEERLGSGAGIDEEADEPTYERFEKTYDEYDDEDGFIDDEDDDDLLEGAERLRNVKREGASKYDEDEEEEEEEEQEDDEESRRKKRRIIDSDDEE